MRPFDSALLVIMLALDARSLEELHGNLSTIFETHNHTAQQQWSQEAHWKTKDSDSCLKRHCFENHTGSLTNWFICRDLLLLGASRCKGKLFWDAWKCWNLGSSYDGYINCETFSTGPQRKQYVFWSLLWVWHYWKTLHSNLDWLKSPTGAKNSDLYRLSNSNFSVDIDLKA